MGGLEVTEQTDIQLKGGTCRKSFIYYLYIKL